MLFFWVSLWANEIRGTNFKAIIRSKRSMASKEQEFVFFETHV